jgi:glutamate-1-semialdehyde 2,1-aminomutase
MATIHLLGALAALAAAACVRPVWQRLALSKAKHPSLAGHAKMARRFARWVPFYEYSDARFFASDDASEEIVLRRRAAFFRLAREYRERYARTAALTTEASALLSDLHFTGAYRVPFQYRRLVREHFPPAGFAAASEGIFLVDLDGTRQYDLTGSYGVNLFGYEFYKACIRDGARMVEPLGPVLGMCHPLALSNAERLRTLSGQDEVSFHMSGTEAVMQAVGLARFHTRRTHLVRFTGAYHGWWGDVQPGVGNPLAANATYTLKDMDEDTLRVLAKRRDIACVLVNPLQGLHPNRGAPGDSSLVDSGRSAGFDRVGYTAWLHRLREVCSARGIVLIFDEIFTGFRLAPGGAQEYFGVSADMVTYGKTVGGGLPVGVLCGRRALMRRFREERPADIYFARGTFNTHPYLMGAMHAFFERFDTPEVRARYAGLDEKWNARAADLNERLAAEVLPVRVANLSTIWTVCYTQPSRYNWMLQYYLRLQGLALSWVGTGRLLWSLDYSDADYAAVADRFVSAARAMREDGWWASGSDASNKSIKRRILREMLTARF